LVVLTNRYLKSNSLHFVFSEGQVISRTAVQYERGIIRKGTEMSKKIRTEFRAAIILIATENISALRVLLKNILGFASKSVHLHRKS
jgi:hypothetical protein